MIFPQWEASQRKLLERNQVESSIGRGIDRSTSREGRKEWKKGRRGSSTFTYFLPRPIYPRRRRFCCWSGKESPNGETWPRPNKAFPLSLPLSPHHVFLPPNTDSLPPSLGGRHPYENVTYTVMPHASYGEYDARE